jgi:hypothetical protein
LVKDRRYRSSDEQRVLSKVRVELVMVHRRSDTVRRDTSNGQIFQRVAIAKVESDDSNGTDASE